MSFFLGLLLLALLASGPPAESYRYTASGLFTAGRSKVLYVQGEIQVSVAGTVDVVVESTEPAIFWIDEEPFEKETRATVPLSPGRHRLTVRVDRGSHPAATLRFELKKPAGSKVAFEVVHTDG